MNTDDVQKLATLARLDISEEEAEFLTKDMNTILQYIKQIEAAEVEISTPKYIQTNVVRNDTVDVADSHITVLIKQNFPKENNGYLEINKIIQND
jgi:aspartyl-tRNA(Asn)/glutamyl-tRNA(Gln) amidotransferase subunit C